MSVQTQIDRITGQVDEQKYYINQLKSTLNGEGESAFVGYTKILRKVGSIDFVGNINYQGANFGFKADIVVFTDFFGVKLNDSNKTYRPASSVCLAEIPKDCNFVEVYCFGADGKEYKIYVSQTTVGFFLHDMLVYQDSKWHQAPTMTLNYVAIKYTE